MTAHSAVTLDRKVAWLAAPGALAPFGAEVRETHLSFVFLTRERAYKLKKPLRHAGLDLTSVGAREKNCRVEVVLNRRLAAGVYRGVVPLVADGAGRLSLAGAGTVVDWLVVMRRLPEEAMLDRAILAGTATPERLAPVGRLLAAFYAHAERAPFPPEAFARRFAREHARDRRTILKFAPLLPHAADVLDQFERALAAAAADLDARARAGYVVDGHGDLRPEHVCLADPPVVIDCLEFSARLRAVDPFEEIAFLDLECSLLGVDWVGPVLTRCLEDGGHAPPCAGLLRLYRAARALVRARLALAHLLEPEVRLPEKWAPLAARHLDRAASALYTARECP